MKLFELRPFAARLTTSTDEPASLRNPGPQPDSSATVESPTRTIRIGFTCPRAKGTCTVANTIASAIDAQAIGRVTHTSRIRLLDLDSGPVPTFEPFAVDGFHRNNCSPLHMGQRHRRLGHANLLRIGLRRWSVTHDVRADACFDAWLPTHRRGSVR